MDATWIVSANAGRARFFAQPRPGAELEEVNDMANTAARLRTADLETDDLGQRAASKSRNNVGAPTQPNGYQPAQTPAQHQVELFARDVAQYLRQAHNEGRFKELGLVASPEFLGTLRKLLDGPIESKVRFEIDKDYTGLRADELRERIREMRAKH